ncbi:hypothetical protein CKAN_01288600 [Cinnamomum micranthum f. kanehirae]|uniref:Uncharacterized protein n=1 Tax=Cinnamomum micranthum f. kanehirae TaxID=337451 RepID=A0A443P020_9MAGN|nr:hypothetical protein CKAN_01288600 [Cinnamomum micranthum f. kanehirae]
MVGTLASNKLPKLQILFHSASQARALNHRGLPSIATILYRTSPKKPSSTSRHRYCSSLNRGRTPMSIVGGKGHNQLNEKKETNLQLQATPAQKPSVHIWTRWVLGTIISLILPFWMTMAELQTIEVEVEKVVGVVENVAEVVEKVAVVAEKLSSEVADKLPDDAKIKDAVLLVEHVSKEVAKDAQLTLDFIHKVEEIKQQVETLLEPHVIDQQKIKISPHQCED